MGFGLEIFRYSEDDECGCELLFKGDVVASKLTLNDAQILKCLIALRLRNPKTKRRALKWLTSTIAALLDPA